MLAAPPIAGHVLASRRLGPDTVLVTKIAGHPTFCPRGYMLAALRQRKVIAHRRIQPTFALMTGGLCGTFIRWLAVGRFVSVDMHVTDSIGEETQVYRLQRGRFRLVHIFGAQGIRAGAGDSFVLTWNSHARDVGHVRQVWRWSRGRFRLVSSR